MEKISPDQIIEELGGCGRYQIRMSVIVHLMKTLTCWSVLSMVVISATPPWWCDYPSSDNSATANMTLHGYAPKTTELELHEYATNTTSRLKSCFSVNKTKCNNIRFDTSKSFVSEFSLVCDRAYIPSTIMSIQTAGTLVGNIMAGQLADMYGRKFPFFSSIILLIVANIVCFFSTNWILFVVARFVVGAGAGFFLTIQYGLLSEFSLSSWRAWIIGFPSWPIEAGVFALFAWLIQDWRYINLLCGLIGIPCLLAWWYIPESFRWYLAHDRQLDAEKVIRQVAKFNRREVSERTERLLEVTETEKKDTKYSVLDLFKSRYLIKVTFLSALNWAGLGLVSYGINFGIQALSGNIYLNVFLFNITGIPTKSVAIWLQNRYGRRKTAMISFCVTAIGGFVVETDYRDELTNGFALLANMGIKMAWGPVQTMTIELYPTVVRNIGFGSLSTVGRVGAIVGPQLVFLNEYIPGLLYFVCGVLSTLCVCCLFGLPETMNSNLSDKIQASTYTEVKMDKMDKHANNGAV